MGSSKSNALCAFPFPPYAALVAVAADVVGIGSGSAFFGSSISFSVGIFQFASRPQHSLPSALMLSTLLLTLPLSLSLPPLAASASPFSWGSSFLVALLSSFFVGMFRFAARAAAAGSMSFDAYHDSRFSSTYSLCCSCCCCPCLLLLPLVACCFPALPAAAFVFC